MFVPIPEEHLVRIYDVTLLCKKDYTEKPAISRRETKSLLVFTGSLVCSAAFALSNNDDQERDHSDLIVL